MADYTPGPWFHSNTSMWGCVTTQKNGLGLVIAEVSSPPTGKGSLDPDRIEQTRANARLIAASPELLSELKTAVSVIEQLAPKGMHRGVVDLALYRFRQVIADAEGSNVP